MPKEDTQEAVSKGDEPTHIRYTGKGSRRVVSINDWSASGVNAKADSEWSFYNDYQLPIGDFTKKQLDLLRAENQFVGVVSE